MSAGNGSTIIQATTKTDAILAAVSHEIERWRAMIESDGDLRSIVVTVHMASGYSHPRAIECGLKSEKRLGAPPIPS